MSFVKIILPRIRVKIMAFEISERAEYRQFKLTQNDTLPPVEVQFIQTLDADCSESYVNLDGYRVDFFFRKENSNVLNMAHSQCTIVNALSGQVKYEWGAGDTANIGIHYGGFQLTQIATGKKQSIRDALRFDIREEVDGVSGVY